MTTFDDDDDRRDVDVERRSDRYVNRRGDAFFPGSLFYLLEFLNFDSFSRIVRFYFAIKNHLNCTTLM